MLRPNTDRQIQQLNEKIKRIRQQLIRLPEGTLSISHQGDHYYYKHRLPDGDLNYISKKDLSLARDLAFRRYLELQLEEYETLQRALVNYNRMVSKVSSKADKYLLENEGIARLLRERFPIENAPLSVWALQPQDSGAPHPQKRMLTCRSGHIVRSKSEAMIDNALFTAQIPFRYEAPLILGQITLYPDFTVRHPVTGAYYYWDHFGMMSDSAYSKSAADKIALYARHGFVPFHNLILTFESMEAPLSDEQIDLMIDYFFS